MAEQSSDQDTQDFASLTDALIPSTIYLNSWSQTGLPASSEAQPFASSFNMFSPTYGGLFPMQNSPRNPLLLQDTVAPNHAAFHANSLQQFDFASQNQDRGVGLTLNPTSCADFFQMEMARTSTAQLPQLAAPSLCSDVPEPPARTTPAKDPLASLKMRAKESVMAKRARSVRSASNDSKMENTDTLGQDLTNKGGLNNLVREEEIEPKSRFSVSAAPASAFTSSESLLRGRQISRKATSAELDDLLAEGKAAASLANNTKEQKLSATEQRGTHGSVHQQSEEIVPEVGEIPDSNSRRGYENMPQPSMIPEHISADEHGEIVVWLTMTGYYDESYRDKVLSRHRRLKEIEEERTKLLEEERDEQRLRGQFHSTVPFYVPQRPTPPVATINPPPSTAKQSVGLRIKDSALKKTTTSDGTIPNDETPAKRRLEEEVTDPETQHQSKVARTEVRRRTPPRSQRASPERRLDRSLSPASDKKDSPTPSRGQSPHFKDNYDRWAPILSNRKTEQRGLMDRVVEDDAARRKDHRGRYDQRRDSGLGNTQQLKPDLQQGRVRFFLLKSWNYENIATAQKENIWATQTKNEEAFVEAFKTCRHVIFFFSANHSKAFQGYARMQGLPGERGVPQPSWVKNLHWPTTEPFRIKWIVRDETPYRAVGNLKNPLNENLAVFVGRDGQEIPEKLGRQLSEIIDEDTAYRADFRR
jgi:YT521-B-like domain